MKTLIASAVLALFAASASASFNLPAGVSAASASGGASVLSGSAVGGASSGNGSTRSLATNTTVARASVGASDGTNVQLGGYSGYGWHSFPTTSTTSGNASVQGDVYTGSSSFAGNISSGNATGGAAAGGTASANVAGTGFYVAPGIAGFVAGTAASLTTNGVIAGRNGVGTVISDNESGFGASAESSRTVNISNSRQLGLVGNTAAVGYSDSHNFSNSAGNAFIIGGQNAPLNGGIFGAAAAATGAGTVSAH